jgi:hypothetical protein
LIQKSGPRPIISDSSPIGCTERDKRHPRRRGLDEVTVAGDEVEDEPHPRHGQRRDADVFEIEIDGLEGEVRRPQLGGVAPAPDGDRREQRRVPRCSANLAAAVRERRQREQNRRPDDERQQAKDHA